LDLFSLTQGNAPETKPDGTQLCNIRRCIALQGRAEWGTRKRFHNRKGAAMKIVSFSVEQGNKYFGKVDGGPKFFIGSRVSYEGSKGLMNVAGTAVQKYDRTAFRPAYGFWADFIHPTAMAEGGLYHTLKHL
jgi:hypothetical protein